MSFVETPLLYTNPFVQQLHLMSKQEAPEVDPNCIYHLLAVALLQVVAKSIRQHTHTDTPCQCQQQGKNKARQPIIYTQDDHFSQGN